MMMLHGWSIYRRRALVRAHIRTLLMWMAVLGRSLIHVIALLLHRLSCLWIGMMLWDEIRTGASYVIS